MLKVWFQNFDQYSHGRDCEALLYLTNTGVFAHIKGVIGGHWILGCVIAHSHEFFTECSLDLIAERIFLILISLGYFFHYRLALIKDLCRHMFFTRIDIIFLHVCRQYPLLFWRPPNLFSFNFVFCKFLRNFINFDGLSASKLGR